MTNDQIIEILSDMNKLKPYLPQEIQLIDFIDSGGQGLVYRGEINGDIAAIKFYYPGQVVKRIDREINALRSINHPNIVKLLWDGEIVISSHHIKFAACDFINGNELKEIILRTPLDEITTGRLILDISCAIEEMWNLNIVHRDIKPNNIMIRSDGTACVIDLGYARHLDKSTQTQFGYVCGTQGYYSPEQALGKKLLTCKSDIYSLGIVTLESSLGCHPTSYDQMAIFSSCFYNQLPEPLNSSSYSNVIKKMLDPIPIKRPSPSLLIDIFKNFNSGGK